MGDSEPARNLEQLTRWSTHIVRAEVLDNWTEWRSIVFREPEPCEEWLMKVFTTYQLRVLESFKGDVEIGDIIEFAFWGGRYGNKETVFTAVRSDKIPLVSGEEFIFFLRSYESIGFGHLPMELLTLNQSVHRVQPLNQRTAGELSNGIISAFNTNPSLADEALERFVLSYDDRHPITLTIGDLVRIANTHNPPAQPNHTVTFNHKGQGTITVSVQHPTH